MIQRKIEIQKLVDGKLTYPSWSTNTKYVLRTERIDGIISVYYKINGGRKIERKFPQTIELTPRFCYVLGLIKGEGSNSIGKSNYRRFTLTNADPAVLLLVLDELDKQNLYKKSDLLNNSCHLLHFRESEEKVIDYWSKKLRLRQEKFKCFNDENRTSANGVCHIYISNVLLRRVVDLLQEYVRTDI